MLENSLMQWLADFLCVDSESINLKSRLLQDLRMDGDDASELLTKFSEMFQVDMTEFEFGKHFRGEPHLFNWWVPGQALELEPITVAHLIQAVTQKKWIPIPPDS